MSLDQKSLGTMVTAFAKAAQPEEASDVQFGIKAFAVDIVYYSGNSIRGGFHSDGGSPIAGWLIMGNRMKMDDDWGYPYDSGNLHMINFTGKKMVTIVQESQSIRINDDKHRQQ